MVEKLKKLVRAYSEENSLVVVIEIFPHIVHFEGSIISSFEVTVHPSQVPEPPYTFKTYGVDVESTMKEIGRFFYRRCDDYLNSKLEKSTKLLETSINRTLEEMKVPLNFYFTEAPKKLDIRFTSSNWVEEGPQFTFSFLLSCWLGMKGEFSARGAADAPQLLKAASFLETVDPFTLEQINSKVYDLFCSTVWAEIVGTFKRAFYTGRHEHLNTSNLTFTFVRKHITDIRNAKPGDPVFGTNRTFVFKGIPSSLLLDLVRDVNSDPFIGLARVSVISSMLGVPMNEDDLRDFHKILLEVKKIAEGDILYART